MFIKSLFSFNTYLVVTIDLYVTKYKVRGLLLGSQKQSDSSPLSFLQGVLTGDDSGLGPLPNSLVYPISVCSVH